MAKYIITVKHGNNGVSATIRDVESRKVASFDIHGPHEITQILFKKFVEERADVEVKHE